MEEVALTEWRNEVHPIVVNHFTWPVGPTVPVGDILQLFYTFFTHTLIREIVQQTNLYAQQCLELQNKDETSETSAEDIAAYLGITLLMGINGRLDLYNYWSMSPVSDFWKSSDTYTLLTTPASLFHVVISLQRFGQFWKLCKTPA